MRIFKKSGYGVFPMLPTNYSFVDATLPDTKGWPSRAFLAKCVAPLFPLPRACISGSGWLLQVSQSCLM